MNEKLKKFLKFDQNKVTRAHVLQSTIACLYVFFVFMIMHTLHYELMVTSLGASAYIAFSSPRTSRSSCFIGGYCIGIFSGLLCAAFVTLVGDNSSFPVYIPAGAVAVFISMFLMTIYDFEHPPSAALAIAIVIDQNPIMIACSGLGCILVLCALKELLKNRLRNL